MTNEDIVQRLREDYCQCVNEPEYKPIRCYTCEAADTIERLLKERDEARAKTATMLGVGDGTGKLFVYGDYDSIKAAQSYIFRAEAAEAQVAALRERYETASYDVQPAGTFQKLNEQVAALREALEVIKSDPANGAHRMIARAALKASSYDPGPTPPKGGSDVMKP